MAKKNEITIRSSAAEYLTFIASAGESGDSFEIRYEDENIWLTQKLMATLYDVETHTINYHIKKIFADSELEESSVIRKFRITAPDSKIKITDVTVAKNCLSEFELNQLNRMVSSYLDFAENMAQRKIPLTMQDWETRLNSFIEMFEYGLLKDAGKVSAAIAKLHAESEFEKYRIIQDRIFMSDYDKYLIELEEQANSSDGNKKA